MRSRHPYGFHFRAETFFNFASSLDDIFLDDPARDQYFGGRSLNTLSHGESFLSFFRGYSFQLDGLYLLDEPEAGLSPQNQAEFINIIRESIARGNRQYIIATHSPIMLGCPEAQILILTHREFRPFRTSKPELIYSTKHFWIIQRSFGVREFLAKWCCARNAVSWKGRATSWHFQASLLFIDIAGERWPGQRNNPKHLGQHERQSSGRWDDGEILYANKVTKEVLGYTLEEFREQGIGKLFFLNEENSDFNQVFIDAVWKKSINNYSEVDYHHPDGSIRRLAANDFLPPRGGGT